LIDYIKQFATIHGVVKVALQQSGAIIGV